MSAAGAKEQSEVFITNLKPYNILELWVTQSVECLTLVPSSGLDLGVMNVSSVLGSTLGMGLLKKQKNKDKPYTVWLLLILMVVKALPSLGTYSVRSVKSTFD